MKCKKGLSSGWHVVMYCIHPHYARKISSHATGDSISNREKQLFGTLTFKPPRRGKSPQTWETLESKQRQVFFALDDWKKPFISNSTTQSYIQKISNFPCIDPTLKSSMANEMPWKTKTGLRDLACLMANSENQDKVHAPWPSNPPSSVAAISEEIDPVEGRRRGYCTYLDWLSTSRATSIEISAVMYIALWKYVLSLAKKNNYQPYQLSFGYRLIQKYQSVDHHPQYESEGTFMGGQRSLSHPSDGQGQISHLGRSYISEIHRPSIIQSPK